MPHHRMYVIFIIVLKRKIMNHYNIEKKSLKPVLIIDQLSKVFGSIPKEGKMVKNQIRKNEEIILTMIAKVIVEIIIKEEI